MMPVPARDAAVDGPAQQVPVVAVAIAQTPDRSGFYALGLLVAYARFAREGRLQAHFAFPPVRLLGEADQASFLAGIGTQPAVYLFSSFVWNHRINLETARAIRARSPGSLIVFGGANIPRQPTNAIAFMNAHQCIDALVLGEGEETLFELLETLSGHRARTGTLRHADYATVKGCVYRLPDLHAVFTGPREQIKNIDAIPSPYLSGVYDETLFKVPILYTETNRGCPFGCTFCDWGGATLSKVRTFGMARILADLEWFAKSRLETIGVLDANFGILKRDVEIAGHVVRLKHETGYPKQFLFNMAKNSAARVGEIALTLTRAGISARQAIAFQTLDRTTLENIARDNIRTTDYENLLYLFRQHNMPMVTELLVGLPGQTLDSFRHDLQKSFDWMIAPAVYLVLVMVNAPMADPEYQQKYRIVVDPDGYLVASYSFTQEDRRRMLELRMLEGACVLQKLAKYFLVYLQVEHGIPAMGFLSRLLEREAALATALPHLHWFVATMKNPESGHIPDWLVAGWSRQEVAILNRDMEAILGEMRQFAQQEYAVNLPDDDMAAVVALQLATTRMMGRALPETHAVVHDAVAYFRQFVTMTSLHELPGSFRRLADFPPGEIRVDAQDVRKPGAFCQSDPGSPEWPLRITGLDF